MTEQHALTWSDTTAHHADSDSQALVQRCLAGDEAAYPTLYALHAGMVYRLAYGLLQQREDAEEVLQDSFEYAFRNLRQYDPRKSAFKTWLYRITVSRSRNKRRRKWLPSLPLSDVHESAVPDPDAPEPVDVITFNDRQTAVWEALKELSPKLRETTVLRYYHGMQFNEIGDILGIPAKTAESRMRLAHKALREILSQSDVV